MGTQVIHRGQLAEFRGHVTLWYVLRWERYDEDGRIIVHSEHCMHCEEYTGSCLDVLVSGYLGS